MKPGHLLFGIAAAFAACILPSPAHAATGSQAIEGVYAWTSVDGSSLDLVMTVDLGAQSTAAFDANTAYVFHTASGPAASAIPGPTSGGVDVICVFNATAPTTQCWAGADYVGGDASAMTFPTGLVSADGKVKVFAARRDDPFFWNRAGYAGFVSTYTMAGPSLPMSDAAGCPPLGATNSAGLLSTLNHDGTGGPPLDSNAGVAVLAVVVEVKKSLLTGNGPIVSVWGATHVRVP